MFYHGEEHDSAFRKITIPEMFLLFFTVYLIAKNRKSNVWFTIVVINYVFMYVIREMTIIDDHI